MAEPNGYIQGSNGEPIELVDSKARAELPKKLTRPATAQVGDYLRIKAIGTDGTMEVEAVPAPTGGATVPTKVSAFENDAGYVNEARVQELLAEFPSFDIQVVQELPAVGEEKTIYLVPFASEDGQYLEYLYVNGAWEVIGSRKDSGENLYYEPADGDTPLVFFTGVKPTTKDNVLAEMVYISKGKIIKAYVKIKCQGSSSMNYAKKNFTVTLYQDEARTIPLYLEFKDWGIKVNKFVLKADWIDHSHSRNVCTARIWKDIVESRPDYDTLPEELKNAPGHGAIVGFPIAVYYNGNYEGIYNWNIGKDPWMWGMDEDNPNHAMLCAEVNNEGTGNATMCNFQGPLWGGIDGTGWSVEIGTNSTELKNSLNALISFVANTDGDAFVNGIEEYLDVQSAMDYYCLCYADCGLDGLGKNMTIGTFNMIRWIFGAYDLDCTWLLYWNGGKFVPADYRCPEDYQENANLLFDKFERYMTARLKANYFRLRKGPLSEANTMRHFERYISEIGSERYADDLAAYPAIPQGSNNNIRQIRAAVRDRFAFTDAKFAAMAPPVPCTGITLDKTVLTFDAAGTQTLTATVTPEGCTDPITWSSDSNSIATVASGVVTAVANGSCNITATCGDHSASCSVAVSGISDEEPDIPIDYTKDALSGATWLTNTSFDKDTGTTKSSNGDHVTEPMTLQDCSYVLGNGMGTSYVGVAVYDKDNNYLGYFEGNKDEGIRISASADNRYAIHVYSPDGEYRNATLIPVDNSNGAEYVSINLSENWAMNNDGRIEVALTSEQGNMVANADQTNITIVTGIARSVVAGNSRAIKSPKLFTLNSWQGSYFLQCEYFETVESAIAYFAEHNTVLEINKRYQ